MRMWALALLLMATGFGAAAAGAAPGDTPPREEKRVSLNLRQTPLRQALAMLFEGSGFNYAVENEVSDPPITLRLTDQPFTAALRTLIRLAAAQAPGLAYRKEEDLFRIYLRRP